MPKDQLTSSQRKEKLKDRAAVILAGFIDSESARPSGGYIRASIDIALEIDYVVETMTLPNYSEDESFTPPSS